jgi:uridylate kinase
VADANSPPYDRILIKLSGESLTGSYAQGIDPHVVRRRADELAQVHVTGVQVAVVMGGGNIFRGATAEEAGMDRAQADYMGMLGTVVNALALQNALEQCGVPTRLMTAIEMRQVAEPFIRRRAIRHLEKGRLVIFAAGTGHPFFTTDTAAVLRSVEIEAQALLMAKNRVDGVYDADPRRSEHARKFVSLDYLDALNLGLEVMDKTALSLSMTNRLPIIVFDIEEPGNLARAARGEDVGTFVGRTSEFVTERVAP